MKFFGREIPTDKINFVMNVVSFILGVIFFVRMQFKFSHTDPPVSVHNDQLDSLIRIETRLNTQIRDLKNIQDRLVRTIKKQ